MSLNAWRAVALAALLIAHLTVNAIAIAAENTDDAEISEITVKAVRIANENPASTYSSLATALRFDPLTELQSRGLAEGQSDVSVRGGLFDNTGFKVGAVTIMDPQTGHYVAELPIDPAVLSTPAIYKGIDAAIEGFNSAIATVAYDIRRIREGGAASLGFGSDSLNYQALRFARRSLLASGNEFNTSVSLARSVGDGSVEFGDHEFMRANLQLQHATATSQSDVILSYQDKFFGWPGAYTGFATLPEIDDTQTTLLLLNHRHEHESGWTQIGGYYRNLEDDYDFDRTTIESGAAGSFEHETRVIGVGVQGLHQLGGIDWRYGAQMTADKLQRSTDLTNGQFNDRQYITLSVVPSIQTTTGNGNTLTWRAGVTLDHSDRDGTESSPLAGVTFSSTDARGTTDWAIEYAATTQLPGYTALNSSTTGLFGGNPLLGRETAKQLSASVSRNSEGFNTRLTLFSRQDDDLVDWTYATTSPFARQANAVDIDVLGIEVFVVRNWDVIDVSLGFTLIDKDADYGNATVDASFYALNFAKQRATMAITYRFANDFELRFDNEYRNQEDNPLRAGDDSAYLASLSLSWRPESLSGLALAFVADNVTDSEYQPFPGTPASGRQLSLSATYSW